MLQPDRIEPQSGVVEARAQVLKNGQVSEDGFTYIHDDAALPSAQDIIVPLNRLKSELFDGRRVGVVLANTDDVFQLETYVPTLSVIVLHFPKFTDGRAYSQARLLRERLKYTGEIRATGQVLPDQLNFMRRCGFDAFVLAKGDPLDAWRLATETFSGVYQPASDPATPAFLRRNGPTQ